jgi:lysophospholipase L1-like esterase
MRELSIHQDKIDGQGTEFRVKLTPYGREPTSARGPLVPQLSAGVKIRYRAKGRPGGGCDNGDHLHPGDAGYKAMGEAIDLKLFR